MGLDSVTHTRVCTYLCVREPTGHLEARIHDVTLGIGNTGEHGFLWGFCCCFVCFSFLLPVLYIKCMLHVE